MLAIERPIEDQALAVPNDPNLEYQKDLRAARIAVVRHGVSLLATPNADIATRKVAIDLTSQDPTQHVNMRSSRNLQETLQLPLNYRHVGALVPVTTNDGIEPGHDVNGRLVRELLADEDEPYTTIAEIRIFDGLEGHEGRHNVSKIAIAVSGVMRTVEFMEQSAGISPRLSPSIQQPVQTSPRTPFGRLY